MKAEYPNFVVSEKLKHPPDTLIMPNRQEKNNKLIAINELLNNKINSRHELMAIKRQLSKKYGFFLLSNSEILNEYKNRLAGGTVSRSLLFEKILRKRTVRTMSGIAPVAVLTKSYPCPGKCAYCPKEKNVPQSYLSNEPAVMRAIRCKFDPYKQVRFRLEALIANGHEPEKIELIVIGGTWSVLPKKYKYWYILQCFKAANEYGDKIPNSKSQLPIKFQITNPKQIQNSKFNQNSKFKIQNLKKELLVEQRKNERTKYRIIGVTLETRPDYINEKELWEMRELGCTRVEIGVQATNDEILAKNKRGHGVSEIVQATKLLKDYGFKVTYHIMPGLYGSTAKKDLVMFKKLFFDERFQPDQIKFYPTVVTRGSLLYKWWQKGKYQPYSDQVLQELIVECKKVVPSYVRIIRLIRDIPGESIIAGNRITNLRQIMKDRGVTCRCIRCREAKEQKFKVKSLKLKVIKYQASSGVEYFLSYESEDEKILYGFCRLRLAAHNAQRITHNAENEMQKNTIPPTPARKASLAIAGGPFIKGEKTALIRELHVYGELVPMGSKKIVQHAGLGKRLMQEAEKIAKKNDYGKIAVISGVGVRGYYRKLGYKLHDSYLIKNLL